MDQIIEHRSAIEWRAAGRKLVGLAAPYNSPTDLGAGISETIKPGAFTKSLSSNKDILALIDHDTGRLLARTKSGTLRLTEDQRGLSFELDLPATRDAEDLLALAQRGDIGGMSFGFKAIAEAWSGTRRELLEIDLREISVIHSWPAYQSTEVAVRSREQFAGRRERQIMTRFLETL